MTRHQRMASGLEAYGFASNDSRQSSIPERALHQLDPSFFFTSTALGLSRVAESTDEPTDLK
jgi:hypothetical protein